MEKTALEKIEWKAPEYNFHEKSPDWFWALGIIALGLIVSAILLKNFLLAVLVFVSGFALALYGARRPNLVSFGAGPRGIQINDRIYGYNDLKSFWIDYNPPQKKELIIESKKTFVPQIIIPLGDTDPEKLRKYLLQFIKEEEIEESLITTISRVLKI